MYKKGFTLIELLVVVAIIGMLSSVVLASLNTARGNARDARRVQDGRQIATALELRYNVTNNYPAGVGVPVSTALTSLVSGDYMPALPVDPLYGASSGNYYQYCTTGSAFEILVWRESAGAYCHIRHGANDTGSGCWMGGGGAPLGTPTPPTIWCDS